MENCNKCQNETGMYFQRQYLPVDYFHGKLNSKVLIIGINPHGKIGENDRNETKNKLANFSPDNSYFADFKKVSKRIFDYLGKETGAIHTDLVKCFSPNYWSLSKSSKAKIIANCGGYLYEQIKIIEPKIIICNGSDVTSYVGQIIPVKDGNDFQTFYIGDFVNNPYVFRSGFIGRIDNYAKKRLGNEIEKILNENNLLL